MKRRTLYRMAWTLLLIPACAAAADAGGAPDAASFFQDPVLSLVQLSPHGRYVAMVATGDDGKQMLAVRDTTDLKKLTVPISSPAREKIVAVHWINENRLGFTLKNYRDEFTSSVDEFAVDRDGAHVAMLISGNRDHRQSTTGSTIKDKVLTADYAFFDVTHDDSDDIIVAKYSWNDIDYSPQSARLFRLDSRSRKLTGILDGIQPPHGLDWLPDASDRPRIVTARVQNRCIRYYRAPAQELWAEMGNAECYGSAQVAPLFFDGDDTLYVQADHEGYGALYRYDVKTMARAPLPFLATPGIDVRGTPVLDYASKKLLGIHLDSDVRATTWLDRRLQRLQDEVDQVLPETANSIDCAADCAHAPVVLVTSTSDRQPAAYFIYNLDSDVMTGLGSSRPAIEPARMGARRFEHYTARDGMTIPVYVTRPPGAAAGPLPTVVLVRADPNARGVAPEWDGQAQFLASRGYLVIQAETRGGTGFGFQHYQAGWRQWGQRMQDDLADAALWSVKQGWSDPKRIAIMGANYGGYATLMGLIDHPDLFRCGVEWSGITDLHLMFSTADDDASQEALHYGLRTLIGDPVQDAAMFTRYSPLPNAARLTRPLLIAQGAQDVREPLADASRFRAAVGKANANVEWLVYADEGHVWRHDRDSVDFWRHVEAFLDQNLKPLR
ncbi:prolyl oligopeptidase family serine peptidase [Rugamonas sp.]|uniref:alpha/beta hydrolase family protein n=1 Tax=Rugamonas sp. TaxID=1926287 RepID=UPI0025FAF964|nr:prolyl oligopeptidase family serine peptidase [Rugamonas sp.]